MRVLLIYPPFAMPDKPYLSLPVLSSYLKGRGIEVVALDANIEFYRRFLSPERLRRAERRAKSRFRELNRRKTLRGNEIPEYAALVEVLANGERVQAADSVFDSPALSIAVRLRRFRHALRLASVPHFPERLDFTLSTGYVRYVSPFRKFASADVLASAKRPSALYEILQEILVPVLRQTDVRVIGLSIAFPDQLIPAFVCARIIKEYASAIHVVLGGTFVSTHMREPANRRLFDSVDGWVLDDGELPLDAFVRAVHRRRPALARVPSLVYLRKGRVVKNRPAPPLDMMDAPPPDYGIFELDRYLMPRDKMALLVRLSRGCYWAKCAFCRTALPFIRCHQQPPADRLYSQLKEIVTKTGVRIVDFTDDSAAPEILDALSRRIIQDGLSIRWSANFRVDRRLTIERLGLFEQAGCHSVSLGLEAYNDRVLRLMRKGTRVELINQTLANLSWTNLSVTAYMIVGFPTETEEEAQRSFEGVYRLVRKGRIRRCIYNVFELTPHSEVWRDPKRFGITQIHRDETLDLAPPTTRFECKGMSRQRASELCLQFIRELARRQDPAQREYGEWPSRLVVGGEPIPVNFRPLNAARLGSAGDRRGQAEGAVWRRHSF